uniref:Uncharacterized protein n=1 Tax=Candidatus Kentrum sp. MB TaxID=2138164 RepID=A0A450X834_9GAMM|nr:MAG: hypothetical protein BECKMB1821G_GA0114241_101319 [Candidatus Kentron sp. MB]VFK29154.1 MAG: hypothetical protein BECKMB1821I_GA0114274_100857 [Candidatus Kentron sp. MB]VFK74697.1 MAG: hypothetical protein BECKMB1821H_GA0114242_100856 [Candidatus Kentron sp. MB]
MASAEQIKALLKSYVDGNDDHFLRIGKTEILEDP